MQYRRVGSSGLKVSAVSLGTWLTFGETMRDEVARACLERALANGVNFFDTSNSYAGGRAEEVLGAFLRPLPRGAYVVATKCFFPMGDGVDERGLSRKSVFEACAASLRRLGTDTIDLYQCHRFDPDVPLAETVRAMSDLIRQGKILYWGVSRWTSEQITDAIRTADELGVDRPISNQPRYNMLDREIETTGVLETCVQHGIGILAHSPLAQGLLTGKYNRHAIPSGSRAATEGAKDWLAPRLAGDDVTRAERLAAIAGETGMALPELALRWCLRHPIVSTVITGASRPEQVDYNCRAAEGTIPDDVLARIDAVPRD